MSDTLDEIKDLLPTTVSLEGEEWVCKIPCMPGLIGVGNTIEEARRVAFGFIPDWVGVLGSRIEELENHYASGIFITGDEVQRLGGVVKAIDAYIHGHIFTHAQIKAAMELRDVSTQRVLAELGIKRCPNDVKKHYVENADSEWTCSTCNGNGFVIEGGGR